MKNLELQKKVELFEALVNDYTPDLILEESDYECDECGRILIDKQVFNNFDKHSYIKIQFGGDNAESVYTYVMTDETEDFIICDFIG